MKKLIIMSIMLILVLTGCGDKVEFTTKEYKKELLEKVHNKEESAIKQYTKITERLEKQIKKGKEEAVNEIDRWKEAEVDIKVKKMFEMSPETKKIAEEMRKSGKLW
ncbi:hypothetical protein H3N56_11315 [Cetobacterium sp. 2A]|uniref:hypothetical protein n=1 Tax=Cetobacterium sp. 2A TaxID=2754723 RepID=UPI00163C9707|nr:hypothetical protein [Cetobacterium sp. 2A]MBC2857021.1 hypothetical protein [Cetobacterium sp. 2A]